MSDPSGVSAVLVTRGNVGVSEICDSIRAAGINDIVIWNNRLEHDVAVYGRYAGIERARHPVVYVQDDDCVLPPESIVDLITAYEPGVLASNMPAPFRAHYSDSCLVGFGAVFDAELPHWAFQRFAFGLIESVETTYAEQVRRIGFGDDPVPLLVEMDSGWGQFSPLRFCRTCDVVFTTLTPRKLLDVPYRNQPWATGPDRMYRQPDHVGERARMLDLAREVRDAS